MQPQYAWWVLALTLGVLEVVSGTLHLLVFAVACAVAGAVAAAGSSLYEQVLATAAIASLGWFWLYRRSVRRAATAGATMPPAVGAIVEVGQWDASRGRLRASGVEWSVELASHCAHGDARPGRFVIERIVGNRLVVKRAAPGD